MRFLVLWPIVEQNLQFMDSTHPSRMIQLQLVKTSPIGTFASVEGGNVSLRNFGSSRAAERTWHELSDSLYKSVQLAIDHIFELFDLRDVDGLDRLEEERSFLDVGTLARSLVRSCLCDDHECNLRSIVCGHLPC